MSETKKIDSSPELSPDLQDFILEKYLTQEERDQKAEEDKLNMDVAVRILREFRAHDLRKDVNEAEDSKSKDDEYRIDVAKDRKARDEYWIDVAKNRKARKAVRLSFMAEIAMLNTEETLTALKSIMDDETEVVVYRSAAKDLLEKLEKKE